MSATSINLINTEICTMRNKLPRFTTESVFPVLVAVLSLVNLYLRQDDLLSLSVLLSLTGIAGTVLYILKNKHYNLPMYIWVWGQLILIDALHADSQAGRITYEPIWDLRQVFDLKFGLFFDSGMSRYGFHINFLPFFYYGALRLLRVSGLAGKELVFTAFRQDNHLGDIFPLQGKVVKRVHLSGEKDWLLVNFPTPFEFEGNSYAHALVKSKDGNPIKPGATGQIVFFRLVQDVSRVGDTGNDIQEFPFIDWALCR